MDQDLRSFVILYRPGPSWDPGKPLSEQGLRPHGLYMKELLDRGRLVMAGPLMKNDGGLVILMAPNREQALQVVAQDPAVRSGIFVGEVLTWSIRFARESLPTRSDTVSPASSPRPQPSTDIR